MVNNTYKVILSTCNTPSLSYNSKGILYVHDMLRGKLVIGDISLKTKEQNDYIEALISPTKMKELFKENVKLKQPELFVQVIMSKNTHTPNNNWIQEYPIDDKKGVESLKLDHALVVEDQILGFNEYKHFPKSNEIETYKKVFHKTFKNQVFEYFTEIANNQNAKDILASIYVYDGDFFFNNPHHLNNIPHYIIHNQPFFKTMNFAYSNKKKYDATKSFTQTMNNSKGFIDCLEVKKHNEDKEYNNTTVYATPSNLIKPNRSSNPRGEQRADTVALGESIVNTMMNVVQSKQKYYSTTYTQQKQVNVLGELFKYENKVNGKTIIYGHGLSLANGQHSSMAYSFIDDLLFEECEENVSEKYSDDIYKKIKIKIELLKEEINKQRNKISIFKQLKKGMILQAKITSAKTKEDEIQVANSSNSTVGGNVDTEVGKFIPLLIKINAQLVEDGLNIQFLYPRCPRMDNYEYVGYETLVTLRNLRRFQNTMSKFRSNGTKSDFDSYKKWVFDIKEETNILKIHNEKREEIENDIEEKNKDLKELESLGTTDGRNYNNVERDLKDLKSNLLEVETQITKYSNYEYNLDSKNAKENYKNVITFNKFFNSVDSKTRLLASKLASGLMFQFDRKQEKEETKHNEDIVTKNIILVANFLSSKDLTKSLNDDYNVDIGVKNGLFDAKTVSNPLQKLILNRLGDPKFDIKEIAEFLIEIRKVELDD